MERTLLVPAIVNAGVLDTSLLLSIHSIGVTGIHNHVVGAPQQVPVAYVLYMFVKRSANDNNNYHWHA